MQITRKEFEITALSEEAKEFIIEERLFVFNHPLTHKIVTEIDGLPFVDYFSAKKVKEKLENRENNCTFVQREGGIYLTIIFSILLIMLLWVIV